MTIHNGVTIHAGGFFQEIMFTGIIEGMGTLMAVRASEGGSRLTVAADFDLTRSRTGDSIAVNGACLTAVEISGKRFTADVSPETLDKTAFKNAKTGDRVNLERALRLSDRIDGHLVSGHIDGTGVIESKQAAGNAVVVSFRVSEDISRYMIPKGSVAIDGISLTINRCSARHFEVSIIPHTASLTTLGIKNAGDRVNIETDMIGKYVERFLMPHHTPKENVTDSGINMTFLAQSGFL